MNKVSLLRFVLFLFFLLPINLNASEIVQDQSFVLRAKVLETMTNQDNVISGTNFKNQTLKVEILEGEDKGEIVSFENDYILLEEGDVFYLSHNIKTDGREFYNVYDPNRLPTLLIFLIIFIILVLVFGGIQGLRGLISLALSLLVIIFVLFPSILGGYSPLLVSIIVSSIIIILGSYITHGFNKTTTSAVFGMIVTVIITGVMAHFAVSGSHLSGVTEEEAVFLNFNTKGSIDLIGLLMGSIMIGLLGVLYDASIAQSVAVEELHKIAPHIKRFDIYKRAIRIGKEHIGALVDTLAIAYVGASLPLLLLFYSINTESFLLLINREIFATEIIRILIGSIGLILAVPVTTLIATYMLIPKSKDEVSKEILEKENNSLEEFKHKH